MALDYTTKSGDTWDLIALNVYGSELKADWLITVDNGSEFALADQLEQSCITGDKRTKVYYCHPYSSWERGSNENVNGMIRRRHPKGTDFSKVTAEEIAATENWINSYPRKIFGYKSAGTMFRECLRELGLTA